MSIFGFDAFPFVHLGQHATNLYDDDDDDNDDDDLRIH